MTTRFLIHGLFLAVLTTAATTTHADDYANAAMLFKNAGASSAFFDNSYGYVIFPTIGKAGVGIGGARGKGRVYVGGQPVGKSTMTQLSLGWQLGAQGFSQIVFFQDKRAFDEFALGNFEFGATASAVAITAGASASAATTGGSAGVSGGRKDASTAGNRYYKGTAVFTIAIGGLMFEASIGGQKFSYHPLSEADRAEMAAADSANAVDVDGVAIDGVAIDGVAVDRVGSDADLNAAAQLPPIEERPAVPETADASTTTRAPDAPLFH